MKTDLTPYKTRIKEYIQAKGIIINDSVNPPLFQCPEHQDNNPSCVLYDDNAWCPVCQKSFDIFELAGTYISSNKFPDKIKEVENTLNLKISNNYQSNNSQIKNTQPDSKPKKKKINLVPITEAQAKKLFKTDKLLWIAGQRGWGDKINGLWLYKNEKGLIELVDVRYEGNPYKKKNVVSFYYNGDKITSKSPPILLYGRETLKEDKPILITEGCKTASIVKKNLTAFLSFTWNGGSGKAKLAEWSILKDKEVYILPDDDEPGLKAAKDIKSKIPNAKIVNPVIKARDIKQSGADIEEILKVMSADEITKYIFNEKNHYQQPITKPDKNNIPPPEPPKDDSDDLPFKVLGVADDGKAYFIDQHGRLFYTRLDSITQGKLLELAPLAFWIAVFGWEDKITKAGWTKAQDWIITVAGRKDFDLDDIRGRGAWREDDGSIIYHDGQRTYGNYDKRKLYLRKQKKDIGITEKPISREEIEEILKAIFDLSFETKADAIRCVAWSTIAPFGGALPWRPAFLLTGDSSSGKTTILDYVIKKISYADCLRGDESSTAGIRAYMQKDSYPLTFDETDDDTDKKRNNREALFSMMRASTSEDAPDIVKGTADQRYINYKSKNMFGFISISTQVESEADLNRMCWINLVKKHDRDEWVKIKNKIETVMTEKACRAIRARTWHKLNTILSLTESAADEIQKVAGGDNRFSMLEGILFATYLVVWLGIEKINKRALNILNNYIRVQPPEKINNSTKDIINRLLDESIPLPNGKYSQRVEIRELLTCIYHNATNLSDDPLDGKKPLEPLDKLEYKRAVGRYGLAVTSDGLLAVRCNHHEIMKIIQKGRGYHRQLKRHPGYVGTKNVSIIGTTHNCILLKDVIDTIPI